MMTNRIAYISSGSGREALHIIRFFSEGNRIISDCVLTDSFGFPSAEFSQYGVETVCYPEDVWQRDAAEIVRTLRNRGVSLVVVDGFSLPIPVDIIEAFPGAVLVKNAEEGKQSVAALSPRGEEMVLEAPDDMAENLWPRAVVAALQKMESRGLSEVPPAVPAAPATPDQEWAETLHVKYEPPRVPEEAPAQPGGEAQPPVMPPEGRQPAFAQGPYIARGPQFAPGQPGGNAAREPMPPAYMLWSILALLFCCLVPAIVALVFSSRVSSLYYSGNIEGARKASRNAEIWIIVSIVLGLVSATFSLPMMLLQ